MDVLISYDMKVPALEASAFYANKTSIERGTGRLEEKRDAIGALAR
jgi:hypothetical protein